MDLILLVVSSESMQIKNFEAERFRSVFFLISSLRGCSVHTILV